MTKIQTLYTESDSQLSRIINQLKYYSETEKPRITDFKNKKQYLSELNYYLAVCNSLDKMIVRKLPINVLVQGANLIVVKQSISPDGDSAFLHRKEVVRRRFLGHEGYCGTLIW